jgi:hypothetical protein
MRIDASDRDAISSEPLIPKLPARAHRKTDVI